MEPRAIIRLIIQVENKDVSNQSQQHRSPCLCIPHNPVMIAVRTNYHSKFVSRELATADEELNPKAEQSILNSANMVTS